MSDIPDKRDDEFKRAAHEAALHRPAPISPDPEQIAREAEQTKQRAHNLRDENEAHYQAQRKDNERLVAATGDEQAAERRRQHGEKVEAMARENAAMLASQARDLDRVRDRFDAIGKNPFDRSSEFAPDGNRFAHEQRRFEKALEDQGGGDLYAAQQRAAGSEFAAFMREHNDFTKRIEKEPNLTERNKLEMRQQIRAADHLAYTSGRVADQSVALTGVEENAVAEKFNARVVVQEQISDDIRQEYDKRNRESYARSLQSADSARDQHTREASLSTPAHMHGVELNDSQSARLAKLQENFENASFEVSHQAEGPSRPPNGGGNSL